MTLICVPIFVESAEEALADARLARESGADLVEMRLDPLLGEDADLALAESIAQRVVEESPLPVIATCRAGDEGGRCEAGDEARLELLAGVVGCDHPPRYVDVEHETTKRAPGAFDGLLRAIDVATRPHAIAPTTVILSHHGMLGRPAGLFRRLGDMRAVERAGVLKVVWRARSVRDTLEMLDLLSDADRPTIGLLMGEEGVASRVLTGKAGGLLTFATLRRPDATAPGQPTIGELLDVYRVRSVGPGTRVLGVVGWPVEHSLSPLAHNAAIHAPGMERDAVFAPMPVAPGWESFKATALELLHDRRFGLGGLSVTIPHKEHLARLAREEGWGTDRATADCGAANTMVVGDDGAVRVYNTDAPAIVGALRERLGDLAGVRVAVIGAGGVARGAAAALCREGAGVRVWNRTAERAARLVEDVRSAVGERARIEAAGVEEALDGARTLVQCTPVGMLSGPDPKGTPVVRGALARLGAGAVVLDTVYSPLETPLLRAARDAGLETIDGAEVFVRQAELQAALFNGAAPPVGLIDGVVRRELARRAGGAGRGSE